MLFAALLSSVGVGVLLVASTLSDVGEDFDVVFRAESGLFVVDLGFMVGFGGGSSLDVVLGGCFVADVEVEEVVIFVVEVVVLLVEVLELLVFELELELDEDIVLASGGFVVVVVVDDDVLLLDELELGFDVVRIVLVLVLRMLVVLVETVKGGGGGGGGVLTALDPSEQGKSN